MQMKPDCREVHRLVSEGLDRRLSVRERFAVRFHLMICDACTTFKRQMDLLRGAMRKFEIPADLPASPGDQQ